MKNVVILGSTGSIGTQTLQIMAEHADQYGVFALSANCNVTLMLQQCRQFQPKLVVMVDVQAAAQLREALNAEGLTHIDVREGMTALAEIVALSEVDIVMAGIVGSAGLFSTLAAVDAGKRVLLANKESLVMSGELLMQRVRKKGALLLPVDSEHNALFQCMPADFVVGICPTVVEKLILTASGGPFLQTPFAKLKYVTPTQAVAHPNWNMGAKISVDSATMLNKGLEVIEAHWLFDMPVAQISVVIHPQSIVHSLVQYRDGSMLAQLGAPDMRIPIASALAWPHRLTTSTARLNLAKLGRLDFAEPDFVRFPALALAYDALRAGGTASCILNAANEVAVAAFLRSELPFMQITQVIDHVLQQLPVSQADSLQAILHADVQARQIAEKIINSMVV